MSEPAPVPADQEETLAKAWAYLTPHPYSDGPIVLDPSKMRKAIATLCAERDQLAADLREAREALHWALAQANTRHGYHVRSPDPHQAAGSASGKEETDVSGS